MKTINANDRHVVRLNVDGRDVSLSVEPRTNLADGLREELGITSVRVGCEQGICGACSVLIDGVSQRACLTLAVQANGQVVTTAAGLGDEIDDLRDALQHHFAFQCGFCASGILITAASWLANSPEPDEMEVRRMLTDNMCRCTGYAGMVKAILDVATQRRKPD
ncbi:MAG: (2Fe-2S)-binding protein [Pseudomonadota bacterium]